MKQLLISLFLGFSIINGMQQQEDIILDGKEYPNKIFITHDEHEIRFTPTEIFRLSTLQNLIQSNVLEEKIKFSQDPGIKATEANLQLIKEIIKQIPEECFKEGQGVLEEELKTQIANLLSNKFTEKSFIDFLDIVQLSDYLGINVAIYNIMVECLINHRLTSQNLQNILENNISIEPQIITGLIKKYLKGGEAQLEKKQSLEFNKIETACMSYDEKYLAIAIKKEEEPAFEIQLWNLTKKTPKKIKSFTVRGSCIDKISFTRNGKYLITVAIPLVSSLGENTDPSNLINFSQVTIFDIASEKKFEPPFSGKVINIEGQDHNTFSVSSQGEPSFNIFSIQKKSLLQKSLLARGGWTKNHYQSLQMNSI